MAVLLYKIMRLRKEYTGKTRWVEIGTVAINEDEHDKEAGFCGTVYLNHQDEIWKLADPRHKRGARHAEGDPHQD